MAKIYKTKNKWLWDRGVVPILFWVNIGITGYLLVIIFHKPITRIHNPAITWLWAALTLFLCIYWIRKINKKADSIETYTKGYICEYIARIILKKKLPKNFFVIRNVTFSKNQWDIDLVVVCHYGVFAVEVKSEHILSVHRKQAKEHAHKLQKYLYGKGIKISYVTPVLVYVLKEALRQKDNDGIEVLGKNELAPYFTRNMPARYNKKLDDKTINEIINLLVNPV